MFDFTKRAKRVLDLYAQQEAKRLNHDSLGPVHVLLGLLKEVDSFATRILRNLNVNTEGLQAELENSNTETSNTLILGRVPANEKFHRVIDFAKDEARRFKHNYIGTEHLLLGIFREGSLANLTSFSSKKIDYNSVRKEATNVLGLSPMPTSSKGEEKVKTPMLDQYGRDLTEMAANSELDPIIGRETEIERVIQILMRKTKNNPILIGEAGVGKTAIVEGLAQKIVGKELPEFLFDRRVITLDMASMVAGTKYRGEFEERMKRVMNEIRSNSDIILFIDELHTIIGAGAAEGAIDAANMLKPALSRGELQCIGATTLNEYRMYVEKDSALERRFQEVMVDEPSEEDALAIIKGLKSSYENHHKVVYADKALEATVKLSARYIAERYLPDKAIDVLDESGSRARLLNSERPQEIIEDEKKIEELIQKKDELVGQQEYEKAAMVRDEVNQAKLRLEEKLSRWREKVAEYRIEVNEDNIREVISKWIGIPLKRLQQSESQKLLRMEEALHERVVGQEEAIHSVSRAIRRARVGVKSEKRPTGSFVFLGPTGVGKTELARALAEYLFGEEGAMFRFDMSEYMEKHTVSKLIGAPPGYVGYDEGGELTEKVRRQPYSVILLDEIEKAHHDISNILLQVLEEGELSDALGHTVDFRETIIIMTSNLGAREFMKNGRVGFAAAESDRTNAQNDRVLEDLKRYFNPEFLNRVDDVVWFHPLSESEIRRVLDFMLQELEDRLVQEKEIHLKFSQKAKEHLIEQGYDPKMGARPMRRVIEKEVEDSLATLILEGKISGAGQVNVGLKQGKLTFRFKADPEKEQQGHNQESERVLEATDPEAGPRGGSETDTELEEPTVVHKESN
jgi:ATP-dependent Clp protease ATP-binding subunit ClpC